MALYAGMWLVRFVVRPGRRRLGWMAGLMLGIAAVSLAATMIVAGSAG